MFDTIIKGGEIYDGSGTQSFIADVGIKNGTIAEVGHGLSGAHQSIDAHGAIVAPAWVDIHTHYDGQVAWDSKLDPSASHGVGTIVMGNCGVGFAPVPQGGENELVELMEGVEDIPGTALYAGIPWGEWETFPEYLDFLAGREYALDIASMIPHGAVRNYVMGARGRDNVAATESEVRQMESLVTQGLVAGAVGFSTSRILGHRSIQGVPVPGTFANTEEVMMIARSLKTAGRGVFQIIPSSTLGPGPEDQPEPAPLKQEVELIARVSRESGRNATFTLFQIDDWPGAWNEMLDFVRQENARGANVFPQVGSRPTGLVFSFDTYHPWMLTPTFMGMANLDSNQRRAKLRRPEVKQRLLTETRDTAAVPVGSMEFAMSNLSMDWQKLFPLASDSSYEPAREESFAALASTCDQSAESLFYDYLAQDGTAAMAIQFFTNYSDFNLDAIYNMQRDALTVTGLSDAGAHVSLIFDAVSPTYQLTYWGRDRTRGPTLPLELIIHRATRKNAQLFGFLDRGLVAPGMKADLNVIDYRTLSLNKLMVVSDLPGGERRLMQAASGYVATLVGGELTRRFDEDTGLRPGRLVRSRAA